MSFRSQVEGVAAATSLLPPEQRKRFETQRAIAACCGYELREILNSRGANTYLLSRWGYCREFRDLDAVQVVIGRIGGSSN
jgi:hypothetical protein